MFFLGISAATNFAFIAGKTDEKKSDVATTSTTSTLFQFKPASSTSSTAGSAGPTAAAGLFKFGAGAGSKEGGAALGTGPSLTAGSAKPAQPAGGGFQFGAPTASATTSAPATFSFTAASDSKPSPLKRTRDGK